MNFEIKPLRVTIVTSYYPPDFTPVSNYYEDIATHISGYGADVTLVCGIPTRLVNEEITKQYAMNPIEIISENLRIIRIGPTKKEGSSLFYRALYHVYRSWCVYNRAKRIETDIFFVSSAPPFLGVFGAWLSRRAKTIYDLQDMFPDTLVNSGKAKEKSALIRLLRKVERYIYRKNTHIRIISKDMYNTLLSRGVPESKISLIYNWVNEFDVSYIERQNNPLFDELSIPRTGFYVCYAGNIGLLQNLDTLINAAEILQTQESMIKIIIIGDGAWKKEMLTRIKNKKLDNISVFPMQDTKSVPFVYNLADVGVVTIAKGVSKGSLPSKTWNIMSASRPVLCEVDKGSELEGIIIENECGLCVPPGDYEGFANAVLTLYKNSEMIRVMGKNGRAFIENNITKNRSTEKIWNCIRSVRNGSD